MRDAFSSLHPGVVLAYFFTVIAVSMFAMHPVVLGISLAASAAYALYLGRSRALRFLAATAVPMLVLFVLMNPLLNHAGTSVLATPLGVRVTLESLLYGLAAGMMFVSVIIWFYCANRVVTSDAVLYLFGRIAPSLALFVAMVVRLVPRFARQARAIIRAQRGIGCDVGEGSPVVRVRRGLRVISILAGWALEQSVDTADSMRSRGYGLSGRTTYATYRFSARDAGWAAAVSLTGAAAVAGIVGGAGAASYFPALDIAGGAPHALVVYAAWALFCFLPLILDGWEEFTWMRLTSRA